MLKRARSISLVGIAALMVGCQPVATDQIIGLVISFILSLFLSGAAV